MVIAITKGDLDSKTIAAVTDHVRDPHYELMLKLLFPGISKDHVRT